MGCLGIKMPKLRYEQDLSSPSPLIHDKEIRLVLIVAERGAEHTECASPPQSFSTSGKGIFLPELAGSSELCCGTASHLLGRHSRKFLPVNIINKQLQQILVIIHR